MLIHERGNVDGGPVLCCGAVATLEKGGSWLLLILVFIRVVDTASSDVIQKITFGLDVFHLVLSIRRWDGSSHINEWTSVHETPRHSGHDGTGPSVQC